MDTDLLDTKFARIGARLKVADRPSRRSRTAGVISLDVQGARRITALVEKDHPLAMSFWEAVGYRVDERVVRRVRNL